MCPPAPVLVIDPFEDGRNFSMTDLLCRSIDCFDVAGVSSIVDVQCADLGVISQAGTDGCLAICLASDGVWDNWKFPDIVNEIVSRQCVFIKHFKSCLHCMGPLFVQEGVGLHGVFGDFDFLFRCLLHPLLNSFLQGITKAESESSKPSSPSHACSGETAAERNAQRVGFCVFVWVLVPCLR